MNHFNAYWMWHMTMAVSIARDDLWHHVLRLQNLLKKRKKVLEMLCWSLMPIVKLARYIHTIVFSNTLFLVGFD